MASSVAADGTSTGARLRLALRVRRLAVLLAIVSLLALGTAASPSAGLEWLGSEAGEFPNIPAEVVLADRPGGLAVNRKTGDLYEADSNHSRVLRFDKDGHFLEGWGWGVGDEENRFERCGPDGEKGLLGEPLYPTCPGGSQRRNSGLSGTGIGQFEAATGVAVDPTNGNVFVEDASPLQPIPIQEFTADGEFVTRFGARGEAGGEQIKDMGGEPVIAVDASERVYILDTAEGNRRMLEFDPEPSGKYTYKRSLFAEAFGFASSLWIDDAGRFYISDAAKIRRFDSPTATAPAWQMKDPEDEAVTIDPTTGEIFFYSLTEGRYHQVKPVGSSEKVDTTFAAAGLQTLAATGVFNPDASIAGHPPGALYVGEQLDPATHKRAHGWIFAPPATFPPAVGAESVNAVGATFATLTGEINPKGFDTHYRFEYGTEGPCSTSRCAEAAAGGVDAGAGTVDQGVSVALSHLSPETTYWFRVVAENQFGQTTGVDSSFRTYPALEAGLPDARGYELVSPVEKHGGEVIPASPEIGSCFECQPGLASIKMPEQAAPDGETIVYEGFPFFPDVEGERGALKENEYRAARTASGWQTRNLSLEAETHGFGYRAFTSDLATAVLQEKEAVLAEGALPGGNEGLYLREPNGTLVPLVRELLEPAPASGLALEYAGGSTDLSHLVLTANRSLTGPTPLAPRAPAVAGLEQDLYEWTNGGLRLVNVLPGNATAAGGAVVGAGKLLAVSPESAPDYAGAVSADGSRIFWTDPTGGKLYVRERGELTREIAHPGRCKAALPISERVCFLAASADGSKVLLSDGRMYDATAEPTVKLLDLTKGHGGFEGIAGASTDLSRIYFVDSEVVTPEQGPAHTAAQAGQPNLFVYEPNVGFVRFIGTMLPFDGAHGVDNLLGSWAPAPADRLAQVTTDGRYLAFDSSASLTGYDNSVSGESCGAKGEPKTCTEVYEYDAQARSLNCVSCNPTGLRPVGFSTLSLLQPIVSRYPQPHNLTPSGRVFFDSFDVLSAGDHFPGVENVYEYERAGQGTCEAAAGCIRLISTGRSKLDASFLSADDEGANVFFTTRQQVLPEQDRDELVDLYDAREGGGFAPPPAPPAPCAGEACRPQTAPGATPPPASSTFFGPGNLVAPPPEQSVDHLVTTHPKPKKCPKGKVRRHHKCVKAHKRKAKRSAHRKPAPHRAGVR